MRSARQQYQYCPSSITVSQRLARSSRLPAFSPPTPSAEDHEAPITICTSPTTPLSSHAEHPSSRRSPWHQLQDPRLHRPFSPRPFRSPPRGPLSSNLSLLPRGLRLRVQHHPRPSLPAPHCSNLRRRVRFRRRPERHLGGCPPLCLQPLHLRLH